MATMELEVAGSPPAEKIGFAADNRSVETAAGRVVEFVEAADSPVAAWAAETAGSPAAASGEAAGNPAVGWPAQAVGSPEAAPEKAAEIPAEPTAHSDTPVVGLVAGGAPKPPIA